jgi:hypothetical protein
VAVMAVVLVIVVHGTSLDPGPASRVKD